MHFGPQTLSSLECAFLETADNKLLKSVITAVIFFTSPCYASMASTVVIMPVCVLVCVTHAGIVSKQLN